MAWDSTLITMLRYTINDVDSPQLFTDSRLKKVLIISAQLMLNDTQFGSTYTINVNAQTIVPDPVCDGDNAFMNLLTLKAACFMDNSTFRTKASSAGIAVKTGSHSVDTRGVLDVYKTLLEKGACKAYEDALWEYKTGVAIPGRAILGPFSGINVDTAYVGLVNRQSHNGV